MKLSELKQCPFCGNNYDFYEKDVVRRYIIHRHRFDGKSANNEDMYDNIDYTPSGKVYCTSCDRYLGNIITDTISAEAQKILKKQSKS